MREGILSGIDWSAIAQAQQQGAFAAVAAAKHTVLRRKSLLTSLDALCALEPDEASREVHCLHLSSHKLPHAARSACWQNIVSLASETM